MTSKRVCNVNADKKKRKKKINETRYTKLNQTVLDLLPQTCNKKPHSIYTPLFISQQNQTSFIHLIIQKAKQTYCQSFPQKNPLLFCPLLSFSMPRTRTHASTTVSDLPNKARHLCRWREPAGNCLFGTIISLALTLRGFYKRQYGSTLIF